MSNHGKGSNHNDGSDRQIIRAVAQSCGWELDRIADAQDLFYRDADEIELRVDYRAEMIRGGLGGRDIYRRQAVACLGEIIDSLRQPLRDAWQARIEDARAARPFEYLSDADGS